MRAVPLHNRLLALATVAILPLALMSGFALSTLLRQQHSEREQTTLALARALAIGIDAEMQLTVSALQTLALAEPIRDVNDDDLVSAYALVKAVRDSHSDWRGALLARPDGSVVFSSERPLGEAMASVVEPASLLEVVRTGKPAVGPLAQGPRGRFGFTVRVPVLRDGQLLYVLSAIVGTEAMLRVIERQKIPAQWVVSVFDAADRRVARSRDHVRSIGSAATPALQALVAGMGERREALGMTSTLEGDEVYTAVARLEPSRWTVALGTSTASVQDALWRSTLLYGSGLVLSSLLGALAAWWISRSITRPVAALRASAAALGAGALVLPHATGLPEIDTVALALSEASASRARFEADREHLFSEYRSALEHAQVASKTKDDFLAMLGHELRNPLAPIVAALELIKRRDPHAVLREREIIERQVKHLSRLVDDLLDISRIVSGRIQLSFEPVDLGDSVRRALELTHPMLEKRAAMPTVLAPPRPVLVRGDPLRLAQVLGNLLNNAAKFTPPDAGITIEWGRSGDQARLVVSDQGAGISEELLPLVFERFVQGAQAFARSQGGLGLGLAIARSLVELHGGTIHAESAGPGRGSRFTIVMPAIDLPDLHAPGATHGVALLQGRTARLLVVDDNADAASMLASLLQLDGYEVMTAASGEEALELVKVHAPVAAILDLGLPGISGYQLAQALRAAPGTRSILLIALTGYGQAKDREQALAAGFDEHMVKPVAVEALRLRLAQYLTDTDARVPS